MFEILTDTAHERIRAMEEDIYGEVESRSENHRKRLGDIDVDHLLRAGTAGPSATTSAPTSHRIPNFKPNEAFLRSKLFPWQRITDTVMKAEDIDAVSDYLYSRGTFNDIEQLLMYIKKILCKDILINFRAALDHRIHREKADPNIKTIVETLKDMILAHIPHRGRLIKMIDPPMTVGRMGKGVVKMDSFTAQLVLDMDQSGWSSMTVTEVTVLYWIKYLDATDKDQEELGKLIHKSWDSAEAKGVTFTVETCRKIGHKYWESVRQNQVTLSRTNGGNKKEEEEIS